MRKYLLLYYVLSLLPAAIFLVGSFINAGGLSFMSAWTLLIVLLLVAAASLSSARILNNKAAKYFKQLLLLLNRECDPHRLLEEGRDLASRIKAPFNEWGSLFMGSWALAYLEIGNRARAKEVLDSMRQSAQASKRPREAGNICLNMHEPIKRLYGVDLALRCLAEAESFVHRVPLNPEFADSIKYIAEERALDLAERDEDDTVLLVVTNDILQSNRSCTRLQVQAAFSKAGAYRRLGDKESERRWLGFVIENGNRLQVVEEARARLVALDQEMLTPLSDPNSATVDAMLEAERIAHAESTKSYDVEEALQELKE
ncbi:MAG: hypothetical protein FWG24_00590 [Eggerthellaceae bacterium]|nr:hypothetical protein [Eggerthellaceae bacterium]